MNSSSNRPWKALRTPTPFMSQPPPPPKEPEGSGVRFVTTSPPPPEEPERHYDVDLSELEALASRPVKERLLADGEKSTWDARAALALEMSKLGAFSKADVDAVTAAAERLGMAFTRSRSHIVVFDGENFTLARNTLVTRAFFQLDSFLRRMAAPKGARR